MRNYGSPYGTGTVHCTWPGCKEPMVPSDGKGHNRPTLCITHLRAYRVKVSGDDGSAGPNKPNLTDDQVAEVRRRMAHLEDPKAIARSMGITKSTVMRLMKR